MHQVEFYITATTYLLPFFLTLVIYSVLAFGNDRQVGIKKAITVSVLKCESPLFILFICRAQVIIKHTTDTTRFVITVLVDEVFVAV